MKAIPFGDDGLSGDSAFYPNKELLLDVADESTFEELSQAWLRQEIEVNLEGKPEGEGAWSFAGPDGERFTLREGDDGLKEKLEDECIEMPVGFWIITPENVETAFIVNDVEVWNDSACYTVNRTLKTLINRLSERIIGNGDVIDGS